MLFSESFIFTLRENPKSADCKSHRLLLKGNFLFMVSSGVYSYLPLGYRVLENINNVTAIVCRNALNDQKRKLSVIIKNKTIGNNLKYTFKLL